MDEAADLVALLDEAALAIDVEVAPGTTVDFAELDRVLLLLRLELEMTGASTDTPSFAHSSLRIRLTEDHSRCLHSISRMRLFEAVCSATEEM